MYSEPRKWFISEKLMELKQALFFTLNESILKLPVSIIDVLHVDEVNQVWFMVHRPSQNVSEFDREFLAKLEFYRKGKDFYMHVTGKACLVTDPEEINNAEHLSAEVRRLASTSMVLVKLHMHDVKIHAIQRKPADFETKLPSLNFRPSAFVKTLQYIVKDIVPVFQSH